MTAKPFSKELHQENDDPARLVVKQYFTNRGYIVKDNPNQYGVDLFLYDKDGNFIMEIECEIKKVWEDYNFPYKGCVDFPERKKKFANKKSIFFMINLLKNRALMVRGTDLLQSPLEEKSNKFMKSGEKFYRVPLEKVRFIDL